MTDEQVGWWAEVIGEIRKDNGDVDWWYKSKDRHDYLEAWWLLSYVDQSRIRHHTKANEYG